MGSPRPYAPSEPSADPVQGSQGASDGRTSASQQDAQGVRLHLLEPLDSTHAARIRAASAEAGLSVVPLESMDAAPANATLIGVGPSIPDPLRVARTLRVKGSQAQLVFFTASSAARDAMQAELIRDPFVYPRSEIVDLPGNTRQLATRMGKVVSEVKRRLHVRHTSRRGRRRIRAATAVVETSTGIAEPLLEHVMAQTRDAVVSTDATGQIVTWNEAAERLFGLAPDRARGGQPLPRHADLGELVQLVLTSGEALEGRVISGANGEHPVSIMASAVPIRDTAGGLIGVSIVARDDSEYQRIQAALREANRQKDEFLAIMSHELRTPLTSILGYTDMVLRGLSGPLAPMTNKYVSNARAAGDRLLELVNGLLDYTRLEAGVERLEMKDVDMDRVLAQVGQMAQTTARNKQVELHVEKSGDFDASVEADEGRIAHVLRSMLGNALKFTPDGGWVRVNLQRDPELDDGVRVTISDSGIGLRPDQISRVWERFYQGDLSLTRPYGGMGLGLSIARHLVSLHGGRVGAESGGPDLGSTFWFSLPKRQPS